MEEWRFVWMRHGEPSAQPTGDNLKPLWHADNWDSLDLVYIHVYHIMKDIRTYY